MGVGGTHSTNILNDLAMFIIDSSSDTESFPVLFLFPHMSGHIFKR